MLYIKTALEIAICHVLKFFLINSQVTSSQKKTRNALREQIIKQSGDKYGPLNVRVAMSTSQSLVISGAKTDDATTEINQIIMVVFMYLIPLRRRK